jgi:hypothetical protein
MAFKISVSRQMKGVPKRASMVHGSWPPSMAAPRIKPLSSDVAQKRDYAKATTVSQSGGGGFNRTGLSGEE